MTDTTTRSIAPAQKPSRKPRRMARQPHTATTTTIATSTAAAIASSRATPAPSRLDQLQALLTREEGASIAEMTHATGWQQHSVRGSMAGALKKRGLVITSDKTSGSRRYHAERPA